MSQVQQIIAHAESHCRDQGLRLTDKRKQVLTWLLEADKALSAYELIDICKLKTGNIVSPMSVYRILDFLQAENLVHKLQSANKYIACSQIACDHNHSVSQFLICRDCKKVNEVEFSQAIISEIQQQIRNSGFHLASTQIELDCVCNDCQEKLH